jgi:hypothetical protein
MLESPYLVEPPDEMFRVEYTRAVLKPSVLRAEDEDLDRAGNRFDIAGAGVLYAASNPEGSYAETTAQFRPEASVIAKMRAAGATETDLADVGVLDSKWAKERTLRTFHIVDPLPFVDLDDPRTHTYLDWAAAELLSEYKVKALDIAIVRGPSRRLTRALSKWIFQQRDEDDRLRYGGIRYGSRLGPYECWAIFSDESRLELLRERAVYPPDQELIAAAEHHGLKLGNPATSPAESAPAPASSSKENVPTSTEEFRALLEDALPETHYPCLVTPPGDGKVHVSAAVQELTPLGMAVTTLCGLSAEASESLLGNDFFVCAECWVALQELAAAS